MSTLHRVTFIDHKGFVLNEWFPTMMTGSLRVQELDVLGMESVDIEEVEIPWDHLSDLIHWLNNNPNSPNIKDGTMNNPATMKPYPHSAPGAATCDPAPRTNSYPPTPAFDVAEGGSPILKWPDVPKPSALDVQPGGDHYKSHAIQPIEYIHANGLPFIEGNVVKYITRWRDKGGVKDLEKIKHYIDLLIELEQRVTKE